MSRTSIFASGSAVVLALLLAAGSPAQAQVDVEVGPVRVEVAGESATPKHELRRARVSNLTGMSVKNTEGATLGSINDVMMDLEEGKIQYVALQHGGLAGIGSKLFAIPWKVFQYKRADGGDYLLLDLDEQTFKDAPGFDSNQWPEEADEKWLEKVDKFYEENERRRRARD